MTPTEMLPEEFVHKLARLVERGCLDVQTHKDQKGILTLRIQFEWDAEHGQVEPRYETNYRVGDREYQTLGVVRDGQLVLPGTGLLSDLDPDLPNQRDLEMPELMSVAGGRG
jgi:hypothetical protein